MNPAILFLVFAVLFGYGMHESHRAGDIVQFYADGVVSAFCAVMAFVFTFGLLSPW